ncbi:DUF2974 domain-containing protein [Candidatus Saccharibacteria bacterium]|nr:DUF2974 domain-containing protein [Candidatus Saccharibacteria bacterium]
MANIFDYVEKYGDIRFENKKFNEVDNLIFSQIAYLDFSHTKINENCHTLEEVGRAYLRKHSLKDVKKLGIAITSAYELLIRVIEKDRYRHLIVSNYVYNTRRDMQFSAMMFRITRGLECVAFEGTDQLISGWREDFEMSCSFPVPSHIEATKYLNEHVSLFGPKVIVCGHSKGGNLALVAPMFMNSVKRQRIKMIYNNDGPGLRPNEYNSPAHQKILKKYVHIVPHSTIVGAMLRDKNYLVVKSDKENILGHAAATWEVVDDHFKRARRSEHSLEIERRLWAWLDKHDDADRKKVLEAVFGTIEGCDILDTISLKKVRNLIKIFRSTKDIDKESKDLVIGLFKEVAIKK